MGASFTLKIAGENFVKQFLKTNLSTATYIHSKIDLPAYGYQV
jgi:predicted amidohydrolase